MFDLVETTDARITYRASGLGSCERALLAARLGYDGQAPPASLQKRFDEGHELEETILLKLASDFGWVLSDFQFEVEFYVGQNANGVPVFVLGHTDALGLPRDFAGGPISVDAKAFAQSTMDDFLAHGIRSFPHYAWQQSCYAYGTGQSQYCLALYNKETTELVVHVQPPPYSYSDICARIMAIEEMVTRQASVGDIPCDGEWGCRYSYLHDVKDTDAIPDESIQLVENYLTAKRKVDAWNKIRSTIGDMLSEQLPYTDDLRTFTGSGLSVSVVTNSKRLNTQKVKELLTAADLSLDDYYTPGVGVHVVVKEKQ